MVGINFYGKSMPKDSIICYHLEGYRGLISNASDVNRLSNATETSIMLCGKAQPPLVGIEPPTTSFLCQCSKRLSYLDKGISVTDPGGREGTSKCVKNICFGRGRLPFASTGALYIYDMLVCNKATF